MLLFQVTKHQRPPSHEYITGAHVISPDSSLTFFANYVQSNQLKIPDMYNYNATNPTIDVRTCTYLYLMWILAHTLANASTSWFSLCSEYE